MSCLLGDGYLLGCDQGTGCHCKVPVRQGIFCELDIEWDVICGVVMCFFTRAVVGCVFGVEFRWDVPCEKDIYWHTLEKDIGWVCSTMELGSLCLVGCMLVGAM